MSKTLDSQLTIDFNEANPFAAKLREGEFSLLVEHNTALAEQPFDSAIAMAEALGRRIRETPRVAGMVVADRQRGEDTHDTVETTRRLAEASGKPVLMVVSGKGSGETRIREQLARAASSGIRNILAVTGDKSDKHPAAHGMQKTPPRHPAGYFDSVQTILTARSTGHGFCLGAGVNPYKYNSADQYLQYYKMIRKIACGADFIVSQVGWDMKKLHELQWFLQMREIGVPALARLTLLSGDAIRRIGDGLVPGVCISRPFAAALQRESDMSENQSLAAQLQRLALQIAGCKLLGYSGVLLGGVRDSGILDMVLKRSEEVMAKHPTYETWAEAWNEHHRAMEFSPMAGAYYVFRNLLSPEQLLYDPEACKLADCPFPQATLRDQVQSAFIDLCLSKKVPEAVGKVLASIVSPGRVPERKQLAYCFNLCPHTCPKDLVYGACGGSKADGVCEFGHELCFFHRVLALAAEKHLLDRLEEPVAGE